MPLVVRIGQCRKVLGITPRPADILGRTNPRAIDTLRVLLARLANWIALEHNLMAPAVAEIRPNAEKV